MSKQDTKSPIKERPETLAGVDIIHFSAHFGGGCVCVVICVFDPQISPCFRLSQGEGETPSRVELPRPDTGGVISPTPSDTRRPTLQRAPRFRRVLRTPSLHRSFR